MIYQKITNLPMFAIKSGNHASFGDNTILIQITDPAYEAPEPKQKFIARHHFEFLDCEPNGSNTDEFTMTQEQAAQIAKILFDAFGAGLNVIVHCHAGHNRSGAIAQAGEAIGFEYVIPGKLSANIHVKSLIMAEFYRII